MTSKRMTRAEMIQWLGDAISTETEKPFEEIDYDFVEECGCLLDELMGKSAAMSEAEIADRMEKLKPDTTSTVRKKIGGKKLWKIVVAAAVVLCMGVTVMAVPAWRQAVLTAIGFEIGNAIDENGITYTHTGEIKVYSDIDELTEAEKLNILSFNDPTGAIKLTSITHLSDSSETVLSFNNPTIIFHIEHNKNTLSDAIKNNSDIVSTALFDAYLKSKDNSAPSSYIAYFTYANNIYNINCPDKDIIITLLNSLYAGD